MVHGREQNLPVDLMYPTAAETGPAPQCGPEYVEWVRRAIASAHNFARAHLEKSAIRQKRGYDAHAREQPSYQVGDKVRYYYPPLKQGNKFAKPWVGPFTVVKKVTEVDYRIQRDSRPERILVVHVDNLKPFEGPLSLDINIQRAPLDDPVDGDPQGTYADDAVFHNMVGLPPDDAPVIDEDSDAQDDPTVSTRPRRKGAGKAPARYGW